MDDWNWDGATVGEHIQTILEKINVIMTLGGGGGGLGP